MKFRFILRTPLWVGGSYPSIEDIVGVFCVSERERERERERKRERERGRDEKKVDAKIEM